MSESKEVRLKIFANLLKMLRYLSKILLGLFLILLILVISVVKLVDRSPYQELAFYKEMDQRLDSLSSHFSVPIDTAVLQVGWSEVNITPSSNLPLAGYGARDPKTMEGVLDSSFIRVVVYQLGARKLAMIFSDLLVIHPELRNAVFESLPSGWQPHEIYFTSTHTHSGQGAWAPGVVGDLFAGAYDPQQVAILRDKAIEAINKAAGNLKPGAVQFGELSVDNLVRNRLVKEKGITDPWLKVARLQSDTLIGHIAVFSAHATCFGADNHLLASDYPGELVRLLNEPFDFGAYAAGAVGSMAVNANGNSPMENIEEVASGLNEQVQLLSLIGLDQLPIQQLTSFRLSLPMRDPHVKLTNSLALRPYIFNMAFGEYSNDISVAVLGQAIFIGLPCDFSGELAVPLYEQARALGYQLFITSFNGGYAGYVIKDEWYDLSKYEARTMSWYGPDAGSYLSEVISRLIQIIHENNETNPARR